MKTGEDVAMLTARNIDVVGLHRDKAWLEATKIFNNVFGGFAMAAMEQFNEAADMIEDTPYYKHEVKKAVKKTAALFEQYGKRMKDGFGDKYVLYADYALQHYQQVASDVNILYFCVKSVLDKYKQQDSALRARMITAKELIRQSILFHNSFWNRAKERTGYDFSRFFAYADFTPMLRTFSVATDSVCQADVDINLGDDQQCNIALVALIYKLGDINVMDDAASGAIAMNRDNPAYADLIQREQEVKAKRAKAEEEQRERLAQMKERAERKAEEQEKENMMARLAGKYKVRKTR